MPVYVDNALIPYRNMLMSHMVADTHQELIDMANLIGVKTKWLQHEGTYREHFDICKAKRELAIKYGAIEVTSLELGKILIKKRTSP